MLDIVNKKVFFDICSLLLEAETFLLDQKKGEKDKPTFSRFVFVFKQVLKYFISLHVIHIFLYLLGKLSL